MIEPLTVQERRVAEGMCPVCARRLNREGECPAAPHDWAGRRPPEHIEVEQPGGIEVRNFQGDTFFLDGPEEPA